MRGIRLMIAGLPLKLKVTRHTLSKLKELRDTERASVTKWHKRGLPALNGSLCMRSCFIPSGAIQDK